MGPPARPGPYHSAAVATAARPRPLPPVARRPLCRRARARSPALARSAPGPTPLAGGTGAWPRPPPQPLACPAPCHAPPGRPPFRNASTRPIHTPEGRRGGRGLSPPTGLPRVPHPCKPSQDVRLPSPSLRRLRHSSCALLPSDPFYARTLLRLSVKTASHHTHDAIDHRHVLCRLAHLM